MAETMNRAGEVARGAGIDATMHPHWGTAAESRLEIEVLLDLLDPTLVGFAPDTGQIAKGGSDILEVMRTYQPRLTHVHLKDWGGSYERDADGKEIDRTGYVNYEPIGSGVLPMADLLTPLIESDFAGWVNVELDGTPRAPRPPRAAAALSRRYLGGLLGAGAAWRR
jgi:sugar phosphate isomerase/epimerase